MDSANFPAGSSVITPLLTEVVNIILSVLNDKKCKIYLFGSWAAGTASQGSDIDIAIDIGGSINNSLFR
ncbi:MAG: nucleotidyltransferase domain-containing protein, partial [Planctomycetes bacterium]|nr:nucleotidyltransferase domain-containing protein [Planctomycetota bacterium]